MDSWDDDEFEVPSVVETTKVVANWDDEEEEEEETVAPTATTDSSAPKGPLKPKQLKKLKLKELEEKRKLEVALTKARLAEQANETEAERKAREKRSIEEADFEAAIDAFATVTKPAPAAGGDVEAAVSSMRLLSLADHEQLGDVVATRISTSSATHALECIKVILTKGSANLSADDMKDLTTIINVIKNEKIAAAKPKGKKKKVTGKQGYANVERSTGGGGAGGKVVNEEEEYGYDEYDDFM